MRITSIILISLVSMMVLAIPAHAWVAEPTEETGYYYMYDDVEEGPPFEYPELPELPDYEPIWDNPNANKITPYGGDPFRYELADSFWYYGQWYEPGDHLYIAEDGWGSFDPASQAGFPDPPFIDPPFPVTDAPNAIMAPLWQDNNCTQTPDPSVTNRFYYLYDQGSNRLTVQWYDIQGNGNIHTYDFELTLEFGGQELLEVDECGVLYSGHLIHFLYNTTSHGWDADNGATGFEDQTGTMGITYPAENLADGRVIRIGYRKVIDHDVAADEIIAPAAFVEANTEVDPITAIGNYGNYAESFDVTLNIYDEEETIVYHNVISLFEEMEPGKDTLGPGEWPLWTPGDPEAYYAAELIVSLNEDQCHANDTCRKYITSLYSHDVGVIDLTNLEGHEWGNSKANPYPAGTKFTCVATVENFGLNAEDSIPVDLKIYDADIDVDSLVWHNTQWIDYLDWQGNEGGNPHRAELTFPTWSTLEDHWYRFECRTELMGDECLENDDQTRHINVGIAEDRQDFPFAIERISYDPSTRIGTISYSLGHRAKVNLKVYSIDGKLVKILIEEMKQTGRHEVTWNCRDQAGCVIPSGIYIFRMEADGFEATRKVILY